jgi:hypothetical protein
MDNQNQIEEAKVIKSLEPQIRFLSKKIKIKGFDSDDIAQELRILVIEELRSKRGINFGVNAWFLRLKWHAIYLYRLHSTEPLSKSITIEKLLGDTDNIDWKNYGRTGKKNKHGK